MYSHLHMGLEATRRLGGDCAALVSRCPGAFHIGLLGPDPYLFASIPPSRGSRNHLGSRLHAVPGEVFLPVLFTLPGRDAAKQAFALGVFGHFLLDSTVHPYITAKYHGLAHSRYEATVEGPFLALVRSPLAGKSPEELLRPVERDRALVKAIDSVASQLSYSLLWEQVDGLYAKCLPKNRFLMNLQYDATGRKARFFSGIDALMGKPGYFSGFSFCQKGPFSEDLFNDGHAVWYAPALPDVPRTESYPELVEAAICEAQAAFPLALAAMQGGPGASDAMNTLVSQYQGRTMSHGPNH